MSLDNIKVPNKSATILIKKLFITFDRYGLNLLMKVINYIELMNESN